MWDELDKVSKTPRVRKGNQSRETGELHESKHKDKAVSGAKQPQNCLFVRNTDIMDPWLLLFREVLSNP